MFCSHEKRCKIGKTSILGKPGHFSLLLSLSMPPFLHPTGRIGSLNCMYGRVCEWTVCRACTECCRAWPPAWEHRTPRQCCQAWQTKWPNKPCRGKKGHNELTMWWLSFFSQNTISLPSFSFVFLLGGFLSYICTEKFFTHACSSLFLKRQVASNSKQEVVELIPS